MSLSPRELDELADRIAERLAERMGRNDGARLVDRVALAERLGVSVPTIERRQAAGELPCIRVGRRVLYDPAVVIAALSSGDKKGGADGA